MRVPVCPLITTRTLCKCAIYAGWSVVIAIAADSLTSGGTLRVQASDAQPKQNKALKAIVPPGERGERRWGKTRPCN
jgi:hypothetical protein